MKRTIVAVCALAFSLPSPSLGQRPLEAVETFLYVVQPGDTCPTIARRVYGDSARYDLIHVYNEDLGPLPHRLEVGRRIVLPVLAPREPGLAAELTGLRPSVRGRPPRREGWRDLQLGSAISRGSRVNTLERAFAELTFRDTTQLALRENTLVILVGETASSVRLGGTEAHLERGSLRARLGELRGERVRVATPSARSDLESGAAVVSVDESSTTRVSNHEGRDARVSRPDGRDTVGVPSGMGSSVSRGARPSPPRPLPPAPTWGEGLPAHWLGFAQRTTVRGRWSPVANARRYRVELTRGTTGAGLVAAVEVPSEVTSFEVHHLPPGRYHARVSAIDMDFFESRPSSAYVFEIVLGHLREPGRGEALDRPFDFGDPSEEVRALEVLPGSTVEAPDGMVCIAEGQPSRVVRLAVPGEVTPACIEPGGDTVGTFELVVREARAQVVGQGSPLRLVDGEPTDVEIVLRTRSRLPGDLTAQASGIRVGSSRWDGERLALTLTAASTSPNELIIVAPGAGAVPIGRLPLLVVPSRRSVPSHEVDPPEPVSSHPPALHEGFATSPLASTVAVRDIERRGVSVAVALAAWAPSDPSIGDRLRASVSAAGDLLDDHLRLSAAAAFDLHGGFAHTAQRGSGDTWLAAAYLPRIDGLPMMFELGAFLPTQGGLGGLGYLRLLPTIEMAVRLLDDRLALRTRQGAILDMDERGSFAWASSYAADVWITGPWSVGAELGFTLGREDDDLIALPVGGVVTAVDLGPLTLEIAGRFGLGDAAASVVAPATLLISLRGGTQPFRPELGW